MTYRAMREEARLACLWRGHDMNPIRMTSESAQGGRRSAAKCKRCPAWVQVIERPQPNETQIAGPAVALACPAEGSQC